MRWSWSVIAQCLAQLLHGVAQPAFGRLLAAARCGRDLGRGQAALVVQEERLALRLRQRGERAIEPLQRLPRLDIAMRLGTRARGRLDAGRILLVVERHPRESSGSP